MIADGKELIALISEIRSQYNCFDNADQKYYEALSLVLRILRHLPSEQPCDDAVKSHSEKQILEGCIALIDEMVGYFREYLDFIDFTPEYDEEKQPFCMSYFHIVNRLFLWHTSHCGGMVLCQDLAQIKMRDFS